MYFECYCMFFYNLKNYVTYKRRGQRKINKPLSAYNKTKQRKHHLLFIQFIPAVGLTRVGREIPVSHCPVTLGITFPPQPTSGQYVDFTISPKATSLTLFYCICCIIAPALTQEKFPLALEISLEASPSKH